MFKKTNKELNRKIDALTKLTKILDVERFKNEKEIEELKKDRDELRDRVEQLEKKLDKLLTNE